MDTKINILLVFWDVELYPNPDDFPEAKFVICYGDSEFFEKVSKHRKILVLIDKKSTHSDRGKGEITLTSIKKLFDDDGKSYKFLNINAKNFTEKIRNFLTKN